VFCPADHPHLDPRTAGNMLRATHRERRATHRGIPGTANQVGEVESMTRAPDTGYRAELYLVHLMPAP
jgi:hypothetical protein